ncbi:MAG: lipocalin-like domain-containing protein, partial [Pseudomonadota bacterium]
MSSVLPGNKAGLQRSGLPQGRALPAGSGRAATALRDLLAALVVVLSSGGCGPVEESQRQQAAIAGGGLRLSSVLGAVDAQGYARARPGTPLRFPADHGAHPDFRSEWWYLTLMLEDDAGNDYGGQFTLFRQALAPPAAADASSSGAAAAVAGPMTAAIAGPMTAAWATRQVYMAHLAVTDVTSAQHLSAERFSRGHPELAGVRNGPFAAFIDNWRLTGGDPAAAFLPLELEAQADQFGWSLELQPDQPRVLQGDAGYSAKGPGQASHYYSYPRLAVSGQLRLGARQIAVHGSGWFDREWSTSVLGTEQVGWDWFALQFDDGREAMAFRLRRADCRRDPFDHGLLVEADGTYRALPAERFLLTPTQWWQPPEPAAVEAEAVLCPDAEPGFPVGWRLTIDGERFDARAAIEDQRMATSVPYWE